MKDEDFASFCQGSLRFNTFQHKTVSINKQPGQAEGDSVAGETTHESLGDEFKGMWMCLKMEVSHLLQNSTLYSCKNNDKPWLGVPNGKWGL